MFCVYFFLMIRRPPSSTRTDTLFPYPTLFRSRWSAILIGFAGAFIVLRPGLDAATPGHIMVIISSAIWGFCLLIIKTLSRTDSSVTVTIWMVLQIGRAHV